MGISLKRVDIVGGKKVNWGRLLSMKDSNFLIVRSRSNAVNRPFLYAMMNRDLHTTYKSSTGNRAIALKLPQGCEVNNHYPTPPLIA
jgi:hypothetical protein